MEDLNTTVAVGTGLLISMVVGATELIKRLFDRDYRASAIIAASVLIGGLGGAFLFENIGFALGLVIGLSSTGLVTGLQKFGNGTTSAPTTLKRK